MLVLGPTKPGCPRFGISSLPREMSCSRFGKSTLPRKTHDIIIRRILVFTWPFGPLAHSLSSFLAGRSRFLGSLPGLCLIFEVLLFVWSRVLCLGVLSETCMKFRQVFGGGLVANKHRIPPEPWTKWERPRSQTQIARFPAAAYLQC